MNNLIMRHYQGESDLPLIVDLFDACERVDRVELSISIAQLQLAIEAPGVDPVRDLSLWEDANGQIIGFGELSIAEPTADNPADGTLWIVVHPAARDGELDSQIIAWAEERMNEVGTERQGQPKLFAWCRNSRVDRMAMLERHGFVEGRQYWFLSQSLKQTIPTAQLPEGFTIRLVNEETEAQAWVNLHNQAFCSAWIYHPLTVESYKYRLQDPDYLPELDFVTVDRDGQFTSICCCTIEKEQNTFVGRQEAWVAWLFTSPDFQRRGLARAMLLHSLAQLKALGMEIAKIGVDSENTFGARQLYESVGFKHLYTNIAYVKNL
jgi:mycothiol synthase